MSTRTRSELYRQTLIPHAPIVAADVDGLRAILADALTNGVRLVRGLSTEHRALVINGKFLPFDELPDLEHGVSDVVLAARAGLQRNFPQHMTEDSPAKPMLLFLAEWSVMAGAYAYRNVAREARKRGRDPRRNGVTLPPDPRWLADTIDHLLRAILPMLQSDGVPIQGTDQFLTASR